MMATWQGEWKDTMLYYTEPGTSPDTGYTTTVYKTELDTLYTTAVTRGFIFSRSFEGRNIMGWDNTKKVFQSVWVDNLGSGITMLEGPWNSDNKTITLKGKMLDPASEKETDFEEVITIIDDKHQKFEMWNTDLKGNRRLTMQIFSTKN